MPSSITRLTALDHDRLLRLVRRAVAPGPSRDRWRDELVHLVRAHLLAEQQVLSADVVDAAGVGAVEAGRRLAEVDGRLRSAAERMAAVPVTSVELADAGAQLQQALTMHADMVTEQLLRPLETAVARKEIRRLGGLYAEARDRALKNEGDGEPPPRRLDLSRAELYELAKKAGIEGRSTMSRKDLIAELQRRQQPW